jgi:nucleotide-binding universal stress UspA family protein
VLVVPESSVSLRSPKKLLVGVDFSDASRSAYEVALSIATAIDVSHGLLLVHTRPGTRELILQDWSGDAFSEEYPYQQADLERWAEIPEAAGLEVELKILEGSTASGPLDAANEHECDWVVVGAQGRTALGALLMGGSTDRLLKLTNRPILVVPPRYRPMNPIPQP